MKSCLRNDEIIKLTFYNEIFCFAEFVLCADEIPPAAPFGFDRRRMTRRVTASFSSGGVKVSHCGARSSAGDGPLLSLRDISPSRGNYPRRL